MEIDIENDVSILKICMSDSEDANENQGTLKMKEFTIVGIGTMTKGVK